MPICQCTHCDSHDGKCGRQFYDADGKRCSSCRSGNRKADEGMGGIGMF